MKLQAEEVVQRLIEGFHKALKTGLEAGGADFLSGMLACGRRTLVEGVRLVREIKTYG